MIKKYVIWSRPNHPRGVSSFEEYIKGNYGWISCSAPLYGSEMKNRYISLLSCEDTKSSDLTDVLSALVQFNAKEISVKLAAMYARKYNPAYREQRTQIQYGYPYIDTDNATIIRDTTHVTYDQSMQDDDDSEQAKLELSKTDIQMVRVVEDLINTLISKGIIALSDLPQLAQTKINNRSAERGKIK